jgi:uncharacterized membrane protein YoaK (UPF0700 family)
MSGPQSHATRIAHDDGVPNASTAGNPAPPLGAQPAPGVWRGLLRDPAHGPLPAILLTLTVVTGLVDAVSILALGRVFVANMTGNVVFVGFALARAPGFSLAASLSALAGFVVGAGLGGRLTRTLGDRRPALIRAGLAIELVLMTTAMTISAIDGRDLGHTSRDLVAGMLAIALGAQNAVVRHHKVPDLTTTVLTMTLTGIAADIRSQPRAVVVRRLLAVATMLGGAACGALLVIHSAPAVALAIAVGLVAATLGLLLAWRPSWA